MDRLVDEAVVKLVLEGDAAAFAEIVRRYQKPVYSLAYRLTNNAEDAQDLAQEAFLKIYQVLDKYNDDYKFFSWMYKVAANVCYTGLRKRKNEAEEVALDNIIEFTPLVPSRHSQPEDYAEAREDQRLVRQAIKELPEKYRVPLVLRYLEDFTYQEIADYLDLPVSTIETRLYRAKSLLQKRLSLVLEGREQHELSGSKE